MRVVPDFRSFLIQNPTSWNAIEAWCPYCLKFQKMQLIHRVWYVRCPSCKHQWGSVTEFVRVYRLVIDPLKKDDSRADVVERNLRASAIAEGGRAL